MFDEVCEDGEEWKDADGYSCEVCGEYVRKCQLTREVACSYQDMTPKFDPIPPKAAWQDDKSQPHLNQPRSAAAMRVSRV